MCIKTKNRRIDDFPPDWMDTVGELFTVLCMAGVVWVVIAVFGGLAR